MNSKKNAALLYHSHPTPGKISLTPTKPCETAKDLALAYSPGVAEPCLEIERHPEDVYKYTSKGNLVAVISNGTAVLGLGNIGPAASKPVMEGKGVLFKVFADIDVFDLELDCKSPEKFIETVIALAPTFGGVNLEDIKAPECFQIEEELKAKLDIPIFHDDQHGTAIIASAALLNALEITKRDIKTIKLVINGAGAAAISCAKIILTLGLPAENLLLCDSKGVIFKGRTENMNEYKEQFAVETPHRTLSEALNGADVFFGLSAKDQMTPNMLKSMAKDPIVFAMANPDPEIDYELALATRSDVIIATGRSDYPNQVNNVLGFPYIFRGALDVRATTINEEMKLAAVYALAALAKESVPDSVRQAYGNEEFSFGKNYLIPKPFDPRVLYFVAPAVAKAAIDSGVAKVKRDIEDYVLHLKGKQNHGRWMVAPYYKIARKSPNKRVAFVEGADEKVLKAAAMALEEGLAKPVLLGDRKDILAAADRAEISIDKMEIVSPKEHPDFSDYVTKYHNLRNRKGVTPTDAKHALQNEIVFASMMLAEKAVDGLICGVGQNYPEMVRPILQIVGLKPGVSNASGLYVVSIQGKLLFLADTTMNVEMTSQKLANIALMSAEFAQTLEVEPRVAMLSFSNFGSFNHPSVKMVKDATDIVRGINPDLAIDGEMQADTAVTSEILNEHFPFSTLSSGANVLVFPDMQSGNISYKLLQRLGGARVVGPVILGLNAPAYVMQRHAGVDEIFNMTTVAVAQAALGEKVISRSETKKLRIANL